MFYAYILKSIATGSYYIGSCKNTAHRLQQHNGGSVRSTKRGIPWIMVLYETFTTRQEAMLRERQVKSWKKREAIERLLEKHF